MSQKVWQCAVSGWKAERHVLLGTPETVADKVQELRAWKKITWQFASDVSHPPG
jgi:alkanesulfonate monooxygenase SsuD/methylene tetrahydromethanopterin reductase-like flavin-dependent oxidoreductase (luciferase family)